MIYPCDTQTISVLIPFNSQSNILPAGDKTILSVLITPSGNNIAGQIQSIKAGDTYLAFIGSQNIFQPTAYFSFYTPLAIQATNSSLLYNSVVYVSYVNRNLASTTPACQENPSLMLASTTAGFTYGEILQNFWLFIIVCGFVIGYILKMVRKK